MTISIQLDREVETRLRQRAAALGKDISDVAREALEEKLAIPETFAEILSPIHAIVKKKGGVDPVKLDALIEECRDEVFSQNQGRPKT